MISIWVNKSQMAKYENALKGIRQGLPIAVSRGLNRTAEQGRTDITEKIKEKVNIKRKTIFKRILYQKATRKRWAAVLGLKDKRIPLIDFGAKLLATQITTLKKHGYQQQDKRNYGVSYKIEQGKRKKIRSEPGKRLFMTTVYGKNTTKEEALLKGNAGHKGVFCVYGKGRKLVELFGPSVVGVFKGAKGIVKKVIKGLQKNVNANIDRQVKLLIEKQKK